MTDVPFEPALINHVKLSVEDGERALIFYEAALAPLGISLVLKVDPAKTQGGGNLFGLGSDGYPVIWLSENGKANTPIHLAFTAVDRKTVDAFHAAAVASGGRDNGVPGIRDRYHRTYYAAYVHDPDGNNIEVVCQR